MRIVTSIPSPPDSVWYAGTVPLRGYALCILAGIFMAVFIGNRRLVARGGLPGQVADVATWAVPFGVLGGRIYHVLTDWSTYFGEGGKGFLGAFRVWEGGLGIWGAIALGALGAYIGCRRHSVAFRPFADAVAPGIAVAQAMGRWGNWFNQELFGKPTSLPWGLEISPLNRPVGYEQFSTFHPTFLYESIACLIIAWMLVWADKKFTMGHGRVFALYVALYCVARGLIENIRIDQAQHFLGIRLNVFTALIIGAGALYYLAWSYERHYGREKLEDGIIVATPGGGGRRRANPISVEEVIAGATVTVTTEKPQASAASGESPAPPVRGRRKKGR